MRNKIQKLIVALILCASIAVIGVFGATGSIQKDLWYKNIQITLDGKTIIPTDANGNYIEPFIIDGTTYLPVRGISSALGLNVDWDANTYTVKLSTKTSQPTTNTQQNVGKVIYNQNGIKMTYLGYEYDDDKRTNRNHNFKMLIENNSSEEITLVSARDKTSINGYMVSGTMYVDIYPGKKVNAVFFFDNKELEKQGITVLNDVEIGFRYELNGTYVHAGPISLMSSSSSSSLSNKTESDNDTQIPKNGFEEAKKYLMQYGYKHTNISSNNISYQYDKSVSGGIVTVMYKEKTDTILMRYEPNYVYGYDIANVIIEFADGSNTADVSMFIAPDNVINTYSPEKTLKKSDISRNYSIRFNDNSIPESIQQSVDEFASQGIQLILTTANDILYKANMTVSDLGFVDFK